MAEQVLIQRVPVDVRDITSQYQRRLLLSRNGLQEAGLAQRQLHGIWIRRYQGSNHRIHVLDTGQKGSFTEEAVIHSHVEGSPRLRVKQAVQAIDRHVSHLNHERGPK